MAGQSSYSWLLIWFTCTVPVALNQIRAQTTEVYVVETAQVDQLANLYLANRVNEVVKFDPTGVKLGYYSNNSLGNIGLIDVTSPMKVLVYYPAFKTGIVLDRRLLETARFNLLDLGFGEINLVSFSRDGTIWVFDDHAQRLFKVNLQGDILLTSEDLRLVFDERITPTKMSESAGNLYLSVPGRGILIFDLFGQYTTQILEPGVSEFQILDEHMLAYQIDDTLAIHRIDRFERNDYLVPQKMTDAKVLLTKEKLILIRKNKIERMPLDVLLGNK